MTDQGFNFGFDQTETAQPTQPTQTAQPGGFDFGFDKTQDTEQTAQKNPRYHNPGGIAQAGPGAWLRDDGSTVLKRQDGAVLQSQDGGTTWEPYQAREGDYQIRKGGPVVNLMSAGQQPGTITHHNPIVPLPGEDFKDTMKRAVEAGKKVTPEQLKEENDENVRNAPATLATALALGATGPVIYGGAKGVSVLKQALVGGDSQILGHPENLMTPESRKAHPYWAGAAETVGGLSGPENAAMLIGSGVLGKLPGAASKVASRLVSTGFGITMISNAVKNVPEFWDVMQGTGKYAGMSDDDRESIAKNMMFHLTVDSAMGAQAMEHGVTGESTPLTEYGEAADLMAGKAATKIAEATKRAPGVIASSVASMLGRTNDFDTAIKRSSKIPSKQVNAYAEKISNVREDLQSILNSNPNVEDPKSFGNAIDEHIKTMESDLQKRAGATKGSNEPVVPNITQRLIDRLDTFFENNKGLYGDDIDVSEAKKRILEGILQSRNGEHFLEPNLFEAENVRRRLSRQGKPQFGNAVPTTDAYKAGSLEAADELRKAIDESYTAKRVDEVQEARRKEANLIDIRDRLFDAQDKAEKMGEGSVFKSMMKMIGVPSSVIAIAFGHPISGAAIGAAVLGDQVAQYLTNPNVNISRAIDIARQNPNARTTTPTMTRENTPLHGALASHYGELIGQSTYDELQGRFMAEIAAKRQRGQGLEAPEKKILDQLNEAHLQETAAKQKAREELKKNIPPQKFATLPEDHEDVMPIEGKLPNNMGTQEGLVHDLAHAVVASQRGLDLVDGIRSHNHPENKSSGDLLSTPIDWSSFVDKDGNAIPKKVAARAADIAATYVAGGVANEMWHGIPFAENEGLRADLDTLTDFLKLSDFSRAEVQKLIEQAKEDAAQILSTPSVREMLEQHAQVREPGLDNQHHFSEDRLNQVIQDVQGAIDASTTGKSTKSAGAGKRADQKAGAGTEAKSEKGNPAVVRQEKQGPAEGKGDGVREDEPTGRAKATEPGNPKLSWEPPKGIEKGIPREELIGSGVKAGEESKPAAETPAWQEGQRTGQTTIAREILRDPNASPEERTWANRVLETPENPKLNEPDEDKLIMGEQQTPLERNFRIEVIDNEGNSHTETIPGFSSKDAIRTAQKKFPDASIWNVDRGDWRVPGSRTKALEGEPIPATEGYSVPNNKRLSMRPGGRDSNQVEFHELGHAMVGLNDGMAADGMLRHTHPDMPRNAIAAIRWDINNLKDPQTNRIAADKMPVVIRILMGGIAADEVFNNIPRTSNHNFATNVPGSDANTAYKFLQNAGYDSTNIINIMHRAVDQAKQHLTRPEVSDIIKENHGLREPGLSPQYHYSPDRLQSMHDEAMRRAQNGAGQANNPGVGGEGGTGRAADVPGGEGGTAQAPGSTVQAELTRPIPSERTTGVHDEAIKAGGAVPGGIQEGDEELGLKDLALFHDPQTGSTLALPTDKITPENVQRELSKSRAAYAEGEARRSTTDQIAAHENQGGSTFTSKGENLAGKDLYSVGSYPERTVQIDKLTPETLAKFKADNADLLAQPGHAVGTWKDPDTGKSVLDISKTYADRNEAIAAGKQANQKAIYHLGGQGEIPTGGTGEAPANPKLSPASSDLDKWLEEKSGYHPDLQAVIKQTGSLSDNPADLKKGGAFITPDGRISNLPAGKHHPDMISAATGDESRSVRPEFLDKTGAIRTRFTVARDGDRLAISTPKTGITPEQADTIRQAVGSVGRNGNLLLERSDTSALNDKSAYKEFATPSDVDTMLRSIGAHPEQKAPGNPKLGPKGSTVPLMKNPLEIEGTGEKEKVNTLDVAKALNQYTKNKVGALELGKADTKEMTRRAMKLAEDEAKYQLNQNNSGKAWYTTDIGVHDGVLKELRPELADPAKLSLFKMSEAVLSAGQKPYGNLKAAIRAWDHYNETGEFSPTNPANGKSWGPRSTAGYGNAMEMINRLIKEKGEQGASDWLLSKHPVSELRQYNKLGVSGRNDEQKLGAMILGEKRGPFAQNLHGIESAFTADMWVSRTWNRWMGTIEHDPQTGEITTDAPRNGQERKLMTESFGKTAEKLGLSTSALQAVLWYYEQGLYDVHGAKKESWSFADAAKRVQQEQQETGKNAEEFNFGANEKPETDQRTQGWLELARSR